MKISIYPYKLGSRSAESLKEKLGVKLIKHNNSKFKGNANKIVINWGSSSLPEEALKCVVLNHPNYVKRAIDKRDFFFLNRENSPPFTFDKEVASVWIKEGGSVVIRHRVDGHGGEGIEIVDNIQDLKEAPLYTKYISKKEEYRIHIFQGEVFFIQRKARVKAVADEKVNWKIRNMAGGFIFANQGVDVCEEARQMAITCLGNLGLDFGAVDLIYNERSNRYYALEVNTAPGLEGTTLLKYVEQFNKFRGV